MPALDEKTSLPHHVAMCDLRYQAIQDIGKRADEAIKTIDRRLAKIEWSALCVAGSVIVQLAGIIVLLVMKIMET